jgi:hypothetical protein
MHRVLRPGGRVVLNVPGPTPPVFEVLERALGRHAGPQAGRFVATVFSLHEPEELCALLAAGGFADARAHVTTETLPLPPAEEFLWQYVHSTPLATVAAGLGDDARAALQQEVAGEWADLAGDGQLLLEVDVTNAPARKT